MPRQIITTTDAPSSPLYSQGVKAGPHVLVSGMVGIDPGTGSLTGTRSRVRPGRRWRTARPFSADPLRRQARRRTAQAARLDPDDRLHRLTRGSTHERTVPTATRNVTPGSRQSSGPSLQIGQVPGP
jgi:hypothetical protein